jgi:hypothetical protein
MGKITLDIEYEYEFRVIAISCHARDYKLCYNLNKQLEFNLIKQDNIKLKVKPDIAAEFSWFLFSDEENHVEYRLVSNKGTVGLLIPEQKQADFFMLINGSPTDSQVAGLLKRIKDTESVLTAFTIDVGALKSKQNLLF